MLVFVLCIWLGYMVFMVVWVLYGIKVGVWMLFWGVEILFVCVGLFVVVMLNVNLGIGDEGCVFFVVVRVYCLNS